MAKPGLLIIGMIVAFQCFGTSGANGEDGNMKQQLNPLAYHGKIYEAICSGAHADIVSVSSFKQLSVNANEETGVVVLSVKKDLSNDGLHEIRLPYAWLQNGENDGDFIEIWPKLDKGAKDALYLCIWFPGQASSYYTSGPPTDGVASDVIPLKTIHDSPVSDTSEVISFLNLKGNAFDDVICKAAVSTSSADRRLARVVIRLRIQSVNPNEAVDLLLAQAVARDSLKYSGAEQAEICAQLAAMLQVDRSIDEKKAEAAVKSLINMLPEIEAQQNIVDVSIRSLSSKVGQSDFSTAKELLTPDQSHSFSQIVAKELNSKDPLTVQAAKGISDWLNTK